TTMFARSGGGTPYRKKSQNAFVINISFLPCTCPIGLQPIQSDIECKCDCDQVLQQNFHVTNCSEENGTITLERNSYI
ncbi:MAG: hypothetical protein K0U41_07900, partial [Gammaproteobacteria bacterium]|nr:hypothetical protein [Gammaproteobacteria bacterium]